METVIRVIIIYLFLMVGLRIMGKREFGQMSPLELLTLLIIPEMVSQALVREDFSLTNALVGVSTLFSLTFLNSMLAHRNKRAADLISGAPTVLIHHGHLLPDHMNRERISPDELFSEMHKAGFERLEQVRWALLEPDGQIAIVPEEQQPQRATPKQVQENQKQ